MALCTLNSVTSDTDKNDEFACVTAPANDVSAQAKIMQDDDSSKVHGISSESSHATSSSAVLDETHCIITSNKTDVQT